MFIKKRLLDNLSKAASQLSKLGSHQDFLSRYDSASAMAKFVETQKSAIENDCAEAANLSELWRIFSPTGEWDSYKGNLLLGEEIFEDLNSLYPFQ